jgi:hypothetical protein
VRDVLLDFLELTAFRDLRWVRDVLRDLRDLRWVRDVLRDLRWVRDVLRDLRWVRDVLRDLRDVLRDRFVFSNNFLIFAIFVIIYYESIINNLH